MINISRIAAIVIAMKSIINMSKLEESGKLLLEVYKNDNQIELIKSAIENRDYVFMNRALQTLMGNIYRLKIDLIIEQNEYSNNNKEQVP
jgi:hypothetical protein